MIYYRVLVLVVLSLLANVANSQISGLGKNSGFTDRLYFGGGLNVQFDSFQSVIGASPSVGYMLSNSTSIGAGITYQFINFKVLNLTTDVYGYRFFLRQNLFSNIFAYTEYENMSYEQNAQIEDSPRFWRNAFYVGGGFFQPFNDRSGFLILALYNLNNRNYQGSPLRFRAGITFSPF